MAIETKYVCDRCKHEQDTDNQMWTVRVFFNHNIHSWRPSNSDTVTLRALWCRKCREEVGLLSISKAAYNKDKPPPAPKPLTLEEMIYAIADQAIEDASQ